MKIREGTYDSEVVREVQTTYKGLDYKGKTCLDIGANIGAFAKLATDAGAKVIAFEPESDNFSLLQANSSESININKAVVGNDDQTRSFFLNTGINKGAHSLEIKRGRDEIKVNCTKFAEILHAYQPEILKIDIEGGEYEILQSIPEIPSCVKQIAIELHLTKKDWRLVQAPKIISMLIANKFTPIKALSIGEKNWHTTGVYRR